MSSAWTDLSVFESHDVVRDKYKVRHDGEITAAKAAEIVSYFSQGRQYFEAAATSGELVKPLLMYYGVNAITRGCILFLNRDSRQASLKPSHGLQVLNWQSTLVDGMKAIGDLEIEIGRSGTFAEFVRVSSEQIAVPGHTDDFKTFDLRLTAAPEIVDTTVVRFKEVLSRIPDLQQIYSDVTGDSSNVFNVGIGQTQLRDRTDIIVFGTRSQAPRLDNLIGSAPQLATASVEAYRAPADDRKALRFTFHHAPKGVPVGGFPPLKYDPPLTLLVLPFPPALDLTIASTLYLFSYAAGMLARYFPQHWLALLAGGRGDRWYPLVREGLRQLPKAFAFAVADHLNA